MLRRKYHHKNKSSQKNQIRFREINKIDDQGKLEQRDLEFPTNGYEIIFYMYDMDEDKKLNLKEFFQIIRFSYIYMSYITDGQ